SRHQAILDVTSDEIHPQKKNPEHQTVRTEGKRRRVGPASAACAGPPPVDDDDDTDIIKVVTTIRDQPLNVQLLKVQQRSADALDRLAQREPIAAPPTKEMSEQETIGLIYRLLCGLRAKAEQQGRVAKSECLQSLVEYFLYAVIG